MNVKAVILKIAKKSASTIYPKIQTKTLVTMSGMHNSHLKIKEFFDIKSEHDPTQNATLNTPSESILPLAKME